MPQTATGDPDVAVRTQIVFRLACAFLEVGSLAAHDALPHRAEARRRSLVRWSSVVPPQMPDCGGMDSTYARHAARTGQVAQMSSASWRRSSSPRSANHRSGSSWLAHAAPSIHDGAVRGSARVLWRR